MIIKNCSFQRNENEIRSGIIIQTDAVLCRAIRCAATRHTLQKAYNARTVYTTFDALSVVVVGGIKYFKIINCTFEMNKLHYTYMTAHCILEVM